MQSTYRFVLKYICDCRNSTVLTHSPADLDIIMEIKAFALLFLSATVGVCYAESDISLKWSTTLVGETGVAPLVEVFVDSSVDIYIIDLVVGYQFPNSSPVIGKRLFFFGEK